MQIFYLQLESHLWLSDTLCCFENIIYFILQQIIILDELFYLCSKYPNDICCYLFYLSSSLEFLVPDLCEKNKKIRQTSSVPYTFSNISLTRPLPLRLGSGPTQLTQTKCFRVARLLGSSSFLLYFDF